MCEPKVDGWNLTRIEAAAHELARFLNFAVAPHDVDEAQKDEWILDLVVGDKDSADRLAELLTELDAALKERGLRVDDKVALDL